jgi:hypothetical protein
MSAEVSGSHKLAAVATRFGAGRPEGGVDGLLVELRNSAYKLLNSLEGWARDRNGDLTEAVRKELRADLRAAPGALTLPPLPERVLLLDGGRGAGKSTILETVRGEIESDPVSRSTIRFADPIDLQNWDPRTNMLEVLCARLHRLDPSIGLDPSLPPPPFVRAEAVGDTDRWAPSRAWEELSRAITARTPRRNVQVGDLEEEWEYGRDRVDRAIELEILFLRYVETLLWAYQPKDPRGRQSACERPLLVIPVDDADMQPEAILPLLRAIRVLRHPRVVFLVAGDSRLMLLQCRAWARTQCKGDHDAIVELGGRFFDRVVPPTHRVRCEPPDPFTFPSVAKSRETTGQNLASLVDSLLGWESGQFKRRAGVLAEAFGGSILPERPRQLHDLYLALVQGKEHITHKRVHGVTGHYGVASHLLRAARTSEVESVDARRFFDAAESCLREWADDFGEVPKHPALDQVERLMMELADLVDTTPSSSAFEMVYENRGADELNRVFDAPVRLARLDRALRLRVHSSRGLGPTLTATVLFVHDLLADVLERHPEVGAVVPKTHVALPELRTVCEHPRSSLELFSAAVAPCSKVWVEGDSTMEGWFRWPLVVPKKWITLAEQAAAVRDLVRKGVVEDLTGVAEVLFGQVVGKPAFAMPELRFLYDDPDGFLGSNPVDSLRKRLVRSRTLGLQIFRDGQRIEPDQVLFELDASIRLWVKSTGWHPPAERFLDWIGVASNKRPLQNLPTTRGWNPRPLESLRFVPTLAVLLPQLEIGLEEAFVRARFCSALPELGLIAHSRPTSDPASARRLSWVGLQQDGFLAANVRTTQAQAVLEKWLAAELWAREGGAVFHIDGGRWPGVPGLSWPVPTTMWPSAAERLCAFWTTLLGQLAEGANLNDWGVEGSLSEERWLDAAKSWVAAVIQLADGEEGELHLHSTDVTWRDIKHRLMGLMGRLENRNVKDPFGSALKEWVRVVAASLSDVEGGPAWVLAPREGIDMGAR